jgi:hypothetical protein
MHTHTGQGTLQPRYRSCCHTRTPQLDCNAPQLETHIHAHHDWLLQLRLPHTHTAS